MKKILLLVFVLIFSISSVDDSTAAKTKSTSKPNVDTNSLGLKLAPLEIRTSLEKGRDKKGFVDVSNPTSKTLTVTTSVQAFRQIDNQGNLQFFDNEQVEKGLKLDLDSFKLPAKSALRMYYILDGKKLPSGDVFAAIFFEAKPNSSKKTVVKTAVRVGTLVSVTNGTPGPRDAKITGVDIPFLQFGKIKGKYRIKNTADPKKATGFFPNVAISTKPIKQDFRSGASLLFAGRERTNSFSKAQDFPGIYRVRVAYKSSFKDAYVVVLTPLAGWILAGIVLLIFMAVFVKRKFGRKRRPRPRKRKRSR